MTVPGASADLRRRMVDGLVQRAALRTEPWRHAFAAVPREVFLPRFFAQSPDGDAYIAIDDSDPSWLSKVYSNAVWPTQLDGDDTSWEQAREQGPVRGEPTCSSTMPSLMAAMLEALDIAAGDRVLEIGTGTGYNAAVIAQRLGNEQVTTVDIDPSLTVRARRHLRTAGHAVDVLTADGTTDTPDATRSGYYDRLVATCSVEAIPQAWLHQLRPGGVLITHLYRDLGGHGLLRLTVGEPGYAQGRFLRDWATFMPARSVHRTDPFLGMDSGTRGAFRTVADTGLDLTDDARPDTLLCALLLPGVSRLQFQPANAGPQLWLSHPDGSWACLDQHTKTVEQHGPRHLWDEAEQIHDIWTNLERPDRQSIGLTITPENQRVWINSPDTGLPWPTGLTE